MSVIAKWGPKRWEVTPSKVITLSNLTTSYAIKAQTNNSIEGSPATNERGMELIPLSFTTDLNAALGVNVEKEISDWKQLVGEAYYFYLAGKRFGPKFKLTKISPNDILLDDFGRMHRAKLNMSFNEIAEETKEKSIETNLTVGPSTEAKAEMKATNIGLANSSRTSIRVGVPVKIIGTKYVSGTTIPDWVKDRKHIISQLKSDKALLGEQGGINSWVYTKDISLM